VRPAQAATAWAQDRLVAEGAQGVATYTVTDASARVENLKTDQDLRDFFTTEQAERYTAHIAVTLAVEHPAGGGRMEVTGTRSVTVPEDASLYDRERTWYAMTDTLMDDLDAELEETLRKELGRYVLAR
jgi:VCBS repeat-containing protein